MSLFRFYSWDQHRRVSRFSTVWGAQSLLNNTRLLAIMLGRLRMSVDDCFKAFLRLFDDISFNKIPAARKYSLQWLSPKIDRHILEDWIGYTIQEYAPAALFRGQDDVFASDPKQCKTAVLAFNVKTGNPFLFRTHGLPDGLIKEDGHSDRMQVIWHTKRTTSSARNLHEPRRKKFHATLPRIVDVARATSASTFRFTSLRAQPEDYADGGLAANNPSLLMYHELKDLIQKAIQGKNQRMQCSGVSGSSGAIIDTFVSIGISNHRNSLSEEHLDSTKSVLRYNGDLFHKVQSVVERPELDTISASETNEMMRLGEIASYYRLIADLSSSSSVWQDWPENWRKALRNAEPSYDIEACAARLVRVKQDRERTKWWTCFAGPLRLTREQMLAEGIRISSTYVKFSTREEEVPNGAIQNFSKDAANRRVHFKKTPSYGRRLMWRVPEFYAALETPRREDCFNDIVTINRLCNDKYWACSCISFVKACWAENGVLILRIVSRICQILSERDIYQEAAIDWGDFFFNVRASKTYLMLDPVDPQALGDASSAHSKSYGMLIECLRWLICALMPRATKGGILPEGIFRTNTVPVGNTNTYVTVFRPFNPSQDHRYHWKDMMTYGLVIDLSFSVKGSTTALTRLSKDAENEPAGLKISYQQLYYLASAGHPSGYVGGCILQGYNIALVPLKEDSWPNHPRFYSYRTRGKRANILELCLRNDQLMDKTMSGYTLSDFRNKWIYVAQSME